MSQVDVIIPCYRYGHYLRACVDSVLSQEGVKVKALVIDDASPDQTPEVASDLMKQDTRLEYRRHGENLGHIATYNEGIEWATGDYMLLLSADDLLVPGALARAGCLLDAHPEAGMCYGPAVPFSNEQQPTDLPSCGTSYSWQVFSGREFLEQALLGNPVPTCTAVVRTQYQRRLGGYRASLPHSGDLEMWLRFAVHGSIGKLACCQGMSRQHSENMSLQYPYGVKDIEQRVAAFASIFEFYRDRIEEAKRLETQAKRVLAEQAFWVASSQFEQRDPDGCQKTLSFALRVCPELRSWAPWSRLRWKRTMGATLWSLLKPIIDSSRRSSCVRGAQRRLGS